MHAAECGFFAIDDFAVSALIDFAAAVGADVEAGFDGDGDQLRKTLKQARAQFSTFCGEFEDFAFFLTHRLFDVRD